MSVHPVIESTGDHSRRRTPPVRVPGAGNFRSVYIFVGWPRACGKPPHWGRTDMTGLDALLVLAISVGIVAVVAAALHFASVVVTHGPAAERSP